jgi:hypothetical protein
MGTFMVQQVMELLGTADPEEAEVSICYQVEGKQAVSSHRMT